MTTRNTILALALSLPVAIMAHAQEQPNAEEMIDRYKTAFNAGNASEVAALFAEDAVLMMPDSDALEGRSAIESHYSGMFEQMAATGLEVRSRDSRQLGDAALIDEGTYSMSVKAPDGAASMITGDYLVIVERGEGDQWLITRQFVNQDMGSAT